MSTSSSSRIKEDGGGKITAATSRSSKSLTPVSGKSISLGSNGKENQRPTSRVRSSTQKPVNRPMARVDKSATVVEVESRPEPRTRRSSSSVPRGRSSSPFEITRALSDLKKSYRVSMGPPQRKGIDSKDLSGKMDERFDLGKRVSKDSGRNRGKSKVNENCQENGKMKIRAGSDDNEKREGDLNSISNQKSDFRNSKENSIFDISSARIKGSADKKKSWLLGAELRSNSRERKTVNKMNNMPTMSRENGVNKYPSKLHEKLAFLEGKVKRIALDIKRTKEMLHMSDPDASNMMLSDIQEKISGIEKAMSHVVGNDDDVNIKLDRSVENEENKLEKQALDVESAFNGVNGDELEARSFHHHNLIRNWTLSKTSGGLETCDLEVGKSSSALNVVEKKISPANENTIALDPPTSLSKEETSGVEITEVHEMDDPVSSAAQNSSLSLLNKEADIDAMLMADENLNESDDQERVPAMICEEDVEDSCMYQLSDIGCKTSTGGWFVAEGESVLLAHSDGSCSFYDIINCEEKSEYKPPAGVSPNMWRDCWIIRAPSADGCSGRYVVAASAGNSVDSGFCSWDFYTKDIQAFHTEDETAHNNTMYRRNALSTIMATENRQWWYRPCGPLMISTASCQRMVRIHDIRDGDNVMKWELQKPVQAMDYASPLQWRNRGKVVIAETDTLSLWDVSAQSPQALLSVSSSGQKISALHVNNTEAELGGGVRQRVSSSEAQGNDGVFCISDSINVLDFRHPCGVGLKIPKVGVNVQSAFSRGDSIYIGCTNLRSAGNKSSSQIQQFSLRKQTLFSTYELPESNAHYNFSALTQVWGNSNIVMGVCGLGLFVFDSLKEGGPQYFTDYGNMQTVKEIIGPNDMYSPSFDFLASRILLISRDRPAKCRYLSQ
ncbi:Transducin/WD40 repeat-like superfamily protein [Abeliophyllum distichum]|uniref:Transducin/WD40 repeat-like superfamily protein n=1 Tax=Abeliophyllum distichum TaxID=126358 RepID=A0ABD1Q0H7_9LAMI